ncbi:hypothetical protein MES5069_180095 [Mesorhizobium escarrei]|uniref:Uncharacterized protein n=1 Tax=Mesorhizobium escarrei TaxID=666018 RepID=A0ABM9DMD0_9HYPH|nr:hypothetical protein MES5069_180095 [Mesorhizobium escarrei]
MKAEAAFAASFQLGFLAPHESGGEGTGPYESPLSGRFAATSPPLRRGEEPRGLERSAGDYTLHLAGHLPRKGAAAASVSPTTNAADWSSATLHLPSRSLTIHPICSLYVPHKTTLNTMRRSNSRGRTGRNGSQHPPC